MRVSWPWIAGLVVPEVRRANRNEDIRFPAETRPFLARPIGTHGGEGLTLIKTRRDLTSFLSTLCGEQFLCVDFHDFKGAQKCYRKYRFIFVDRKPYPYHLAIASSWLVHYWRAEMIRDTWKMAEEQAFLDDWRSVFGRSTEVVEEIAQRLDLDYGGMDCSLLPNGDVLLFEANACMLVHLDDSNIEFPYKHRAVPKIRAAITDLIRRRLDTGSIR